MASLYQSTSGQTVNLVFFKIMAGFLLKTTTVFEEKLGNRDESISRESIICYADYAVVSAEPVKLQNAFLNMMAILFLKSDKY